MYSILGPLSPSVTMQLVWEEDMVAGRDAASGKLALTSIALRPLQSHA